MRVTILTSAYTLGGAEKHAFLVADYLNNVLKIPTEFCVIEKGTGELETMCRAAGIPARVVGPFKSLTKPFDYFTLKTEAKKLTGFGSDVIMSFNLVPNLLNAILGRRAGAKCIAWTQQTTLDCENLSDFHIEALRGCDCYISNSQHGADYLRQKFDVDAEKLFVVKNGFQRSATIKYSPEQWWQRTGVKPEQFKAAMIAHIEARKDHASLIKGWKLVVEHGRKLGKEPLLYIAGKMGPDTGDLHRLAMDSGIYTNIRFLGPIDDAQGLYNSVDLCVFYSKKEGMPNSLVEAMLQKLPVVANDIAGNVEAVGSINAEYTSDTGNVADFAEKVIRFMEDPELCRAVGERNYEYANKEFSFDILGESTYKILNDSLSNAKPTKQRWL